MLTAQEMRDEQLEKAKKSKLFKLLTKSIDDKLKQNNQDTCVFAVTKDKLTDIDKAYFSKYGYSVTERPYGVEVSWGIVETQTITGTSYGGDCSTYTNS